MNKTQGEIINFLEKRLQQPLPGDAAHLEMTPYRAKYVGVTPDDARQSAVLVNLVNMDNKLCILMVKRAAYDGVHSAQVSFPGGRREENDIDNAFTALRENEEETGIATSDIKIIGELSPIYIPPSKSMVHAFVGVMEKEPVLKPDTREVDYIFYLPLEKLLDEKIHITGDITLHGGMVLKDIPYYNYNNEKIWGATCAMLNELKTILKEI